MFLGLITILILGFNSLFEYVIKKIITFSTLRQLKKLGILFFPVLTSLIIWSRT